MTTHECNDEKIVHWAYTLSRAHTFISLENYCQKFNKDSNNECAEGIIKCLLKEDLDTEHRRIALLALMDVYIASDEHENVKSTIDEIQKLNEFSSTPPLNDVNFRISVGNAFVQYRLGNTNEAIDLIKSAIGAKGYFNFLNSVYIGHAYSLYGRMLRKFSSDNYRKKEIVQNEYLEILETAKNHLIFALTIFVDLGRIDQVCGIRYYIADILLAYDTISESLSLKNTVENWIKEPPQNADSVLAPTQSILEGRVKIEYSPCDWEGAFKDFKTAIDGSKRIDNFRLLASSYKWIIEYSLKNITKPPLDAGSVNEYNFCRELGQAISNLNRDIQDALSNATDLQYCNYIKQNAKRLGNKFNDRLFALKCTIIKIPE